MLLLDDDYSVSLDTDIINKIIKDTQSEYYMEQLLYKANHVNAKAVSGDYDLETAYYIMLAQVASDAGKAKKNQANKEMFDFLEKAYASSEEATNALRFGYDIKEIYIYKALLMASKSSKFNYYVTMDRDQNGYQSIVTYFEWEDTTTETKQVSFHSFFDTYLNYNYEFGDCIFNMRHKRHFRKTEWDGVLGGSRKAVIELINQNNFNSCYLDYSLSF